jgi:protein transport protein SEC61 subunit gamma-like protein
MLDVRERLRQYRRVLQIARKPSKEEFVSSGKICTIGIFIIGMVGFLIFIAFMVLGL